ncbi:MAG: hypothetical protein ACI8ZB_004401 [Desulforhopalus sp.]
MQPEYRILITFQRSSIKVRLHARAPRTSLNSLPHSYGAASIAFAQTYHLAQFHHYGQNSIIAISFLTRNSHDLFDLKLNRMILLINDNLVEKQGVFHFKSKNSPFGSIDFSAKSALQGTCGSLLQQRGLCLDLRKTLLMRNPG